MNIGFVITFAHNNVLELPSAAERQYIEQYVREDLWTASDRQAYWPMHTPHVRSFEKDGEWLMEFRGKLYISVPEKISTSMALDQLIENIHRLSRTLSERFEYRDVVCLL